MKEETFEFFGKQCKASNGSWSSLPMVMREFEALRPKSGAKA